MAIYLNILSKFDKKGFDQAESNLSKFGKSVGNIAAAATAAIGTIAVKSVQSFAEFDSKMQQSVAIMGDVSDAMRNEMSNAAREVAKTTTFSASEAAESYFFLASAGLNAEQSIAALPKVAAFAQAGMFDMATATDLLTDAQSALGLTSDDTATNLENMANLGDVLVKANTLANASVSQFSEALTNKAAASMRSLNIATEEGVAVLAVFADQGIKGSQAGTTFNATIRGLTQGVQRNAEEFAAMGVEVFNAEGEMNNMADIVGQLEAGLAGMSVEQQRAELTALGFTEETLAGTLALLGNSEAIREYEAELRDAAGTVDEVAGKQLDTLSGQFALMQSAVQDVGLEIGKILVPILLNLMTLLQPAIDRLLPIFAEIFEDLSPVIEQLAMVFVDLVEALLPFLPIIGDIAGIVLDLIAQLLPPFVELVDALLPIFETLVPLVGEFLSDALALFAPLLVDIIETMAPLIEQMMPIFAELFEALAPLVLDLIEAGMPLIEELLPLIAYILETLVIPMMQWLAGTINDNVVPALGYLINVFGEWAENTSETIKGWRQNWYEFSKWLIGSLNSLLTGIETWANGWIDTLNEALRASNEFLGTDFDMVMRVDFGQIDMPKPPPVDIPVIPRIVDTSTLAGIRALSYTPADTSTFEGVMRASGIGLAEGGVVKARPGGIFANIGEGRYDEAVIPLKPGMNMGGTYNITVNAGMGADGTRIGEQIVKEIRRYERISGPVFARA